MAQHVDAARVTLNVAGYVAGWLFAVRVAVWACRQTSPDRQGADEP